LISLPSKLYSRVSTLKELFDMDKITMDVLHGTLLAYELRIKEEKLENKVATFEASKEGKKHENQAHSNSDEEESKFVRKLKKRN